MASTEQGGYMTVDRVVHEAAAPRLLSDEIGGPAACPANRPCGVGYGPRASPVELVYWLALTDLFRQLSELPAEATGPGKHLHRSQQLQSSSGGANSQVTRDVVGFRVSGQLECRAQIAEFRSLEGEGISPVDAARARVLESEGKNLEDQPKRPEHQRYKGRAEFFMKQQGSIEQAERYGLELYLAMDVEASAGDPSASVTYLLKCTASVPIFASDLDGFGYGVGLRSQQWRVVVFPR